VRGTIKEPATKLMMRKFLGLVLATVLATTVHSSAAQQQGKIPRIGFLSTRGEPNSPGPTVEAFRQGLRDFGYVEGKNIQIEYRYEAGRVDHLPTIVAEFLSLKLAVLVLTALTAIRAAKQATNTTPIVMMTTQDPVATGLIDSLAHPGGNITGLTTLTKELSGKRLELLKEIVPNLSRVAVLWNADASGSVTGFQEYETAARALKIQLQSLPVRAPKPDLERTFNAAINGHVGGLLAIRQSLISGLRKSIAELAIKHRLPLIAEGDDFVESGALMSYSTSDTDRYRRAAYYVDRILKGAKPADLPVEQPTKFEFVINLKTAKALNLTIPQSVLFRADKVIK
jgi:putative ABC transport system substrate-binding protein